VANQRKTREQLIAELKALRRQIADLEALTVEHRRTERALQKNVLVSEAALRKSEATEQALLESASEGILLVAADGRIALVNAAAERMFGYRREELLGRTMEVLLPERVRHGHVQHRADYFRRPRVRPMGMGLDLAGRRQDGSEFPVEISLSYVDSEEGPVAMAFITDISERKRAEGELRRQRDSLFQTEKLAALGGLAAGIAHEINNPLGIISSRIEVMLIEAEGQDLPAQLVEDLQVLLRNTQRAARIATSLRSFARGSSSEHAPVDVNAVVEETVLLMQKLLATDGIQLTTTLDRTLPPMLGDANSLHQVLLNLLTNAREAMARGGQIRVETGPVEGRPGWLTLVIADTGPGISPEDLPRIFDPFYTTKPRGTGLGLSLSYGIIRDHQGTVDVQSEAGRGTRFILNFPVARTDEHSSSED